MRRKTFLLGVLAAASLSGCNSATPGNTTSNQSAQEKPSLKVALLTPGDINDQGWNQLANEGLQGVKQEFGAQVSHQVTKNAADQQPAMRDFADSNYNLVLCHGFEYGERAKAIAAKYPQTNFLIVGGNVSQKPNLATLIPKLEDATYLLGMAAGGLTKSNVIGLIGGMDLPVVKSTFDAFALGVKATNPKARIITNYIGNFEDQNAGKEAAKSMIAQRADILFHNADQAGKGMFVAAQESPGVLVFGSNRDQNSVAPKSCLASAVLDMPAAFEDAARDVQAGKFNATPREMNLKNNRVDVKWNSALKSRVPAALMQKIEAARAQIKSGVLKIERKV